MKKMRLFLYGFITTILTIGALMIGCGGSSSGSNNCISIDGYCSNSNQCCSGLNCRYTGAQGGWRCMDY